MGMLDSVVSKIPFTSGILGFKSFCFCSLSPIWKPYPFHLNPPEGYMDPCFGPAAPPTPCLPLPQSENDLIMEDPVPCLLGERDGKGHYLSCSLELQLDKGSSYLLLFWSHISSLCQMLSSHFAGWGTQAHSSETMGLRLAWDFQWCLRPHLLLPYSFLWSSFTGLQQTASVSNGFMKGQFTI